MKKIKRFEFKTSYEKEIDEKLTEIVNDFCYNIIHYQEKKTANGFKIIVLGEKISEIKRNL